MPGVPNQPFPGRERNTLEAMGRYNDDLSNHRRLRRELDEIAATLARLSQEISLASSSSGSENTWTINAETKTWTIPAITGEAFGVSPGGYRTIRDVSRYAYARLVVNVAMSPPPPSGVLYLRWSTDGFATGQPFFEENIGLSISGGGTLKTGWRQISQSISGQDVSIALFGTSDGGTSFVFGMIEVQFTSDGSPTVGERDVS